MPRPIKEIYPTLEKYVSKDALIWILKDCLSKNDLEAIANQCRIQYLGTRTAAQGIEALSRDIGQEFFKNPKARELIAHYLAGATQEEISIISKKVPSEILSKLREPQSPMMATGKVGKFLWALLMDERAEVIPIIPIFILNVFETIRKFTNILQQIKKQETASPKSTFSMPPRSPFPPHPQNLQLKGELEKVKKELTFSKEEVEKLGEKNNQLEVRFQDLHNKYKITLSEAQELKHERNNSAKKIRDLEHELTEIESRYKNIEKLQHQWHQLDRDNKMLRYELEKREKSLEEISQLKAQNDHFQKTQIHLEKKLKNLEILLQEKEEDLAHIKEEIKKEALIKKEAKKAVKSPTPRVAIFVDVQNIYYAAKEKYEGKLDFQKLLYETLQGRKLVKAVAYVVITPEIKQTNFISTLESIGYEIKLKNLKIRLDGSAKGDWDLGIAIDTLLLADKMDVAVLVSGDGDFVDLVRMLKAKNIRVEVASFPHNTSGDLIDSVDFHFTLDEKILLPS